MVRRYPASKKHETCPQVVITVNNVYRRLPVSQAPFLVLYNEAGKCE